MSTTPGVGQAAIAVVEALSSNGYDWTAVDDKVSRAYHEYLRLRGPRGYNTSSIPKES